MYSNFPDPDHLQSMVDHYKNEKLGYLDAVETLLMLSGASLNWIGDYLTDKNIAWEKKELFLDDLYLTGIEPEYSDIVITICKRDPKLLREYIKNHPESHPLFEKLKLSNHPIMVRFEDEKNKVLDGMHRVVAAIYSGNTKITAFVATTNGTFLPQCEAHVVYDIIRSYERGINTDTEGMISALRFLRKSYSNDDDIIRNRFGPQWLRDVKMQDILNRVLED